MIIKGENLNPGNHQINVNYNITHSAFIETSILPDLTVNI